MAHRWCFGSTSGARLAARRCLAVKSSPPPPPGRFGLASPGDRIILPSGYAPIDIWIPATDKIMRGKLWIGFASFLSKRYVSTCRTSSFSPSSSCSAIQPWLFVGLGNPSEKYQSTRHNVGFDMIDAFAKSQDISLTTHHFKALFGEGMVDGIPVLLAKPQTYINLSGESVGPLAAYYKLSLNHVLVAYDDSDLPCGVFRLQPKGGYGRHNGLIDSAMKEGVDILKMVVTKGLAEAARLSNVDQKYKHLISDEQQQ
ncbi:hypothetical protein ACQ4PT_005021 [Festuca glaucescens]